MSNTVMKKSTKRLLLKLLDLREEFEEQDFQNVLQVLKNKEQDELYQSVLQLLIEVDHVCEEAVLSKQATKKKQETAVYSEMINHDNIDQLDEKTQERYKKLEKIREMITSKKAFPRKELLKDFVSRLVSFTKKDPKRSEIEQVYLQRLYDQPIGVIEAELELLIQRNNQLQQEEVDAFLRMADRMVNSKK